MFPRIEEGRKRNMCKIIINKQKKSYYITSIFLMSTCPQRQRDSIGAAARSGDGRYQRARGQIDVRSVNLFSNISLHRCNLLMLKPKRRFLHLNML